MWRYHLKCHEHVYNVEFLFQARSIKQLYNIKIEKNHF